MEERTKIRRVVMWSTMVGTEWMLKSDGTIWTHVAGEWRYVRRSPPGETVAQFARRIVTNPDYHDVAFLMPQLNVFGGHF